MRAIIIDDERLARKELNNLLENYPEIEIVDQAVNADEALEKIIQLDPDIPLACVPETIFEGVPL